MSFGGADCSSSGNPLSQFQKHVQDDKTLQRDRLVNRGPNGSVSGFRSGPSGGSQDERMNSFLNQTPSLQQELSMPGGAMGQIRIDSPQAGVHLHAQSSSPHWGIEFNSQAAMESVFKVPPGTRFGPEDIARFQQMTQQHSSQSGTSVHPMAKYRPMLGVGMMNPSFGYGMMNQNMLQQPPMLHMAQQPAEAKGKQKVVELDDHKWEEQFKRMELQDNKPGQNVEGLQSSAEEKFKAAQKTMLADYELQLRLLEQQNKERMMAYKEAQMQPNSQEEEVINKDLQSETNFGDFESIWNGIQATNESMKELEKQGLDLDDFSLHNDWSPDFQGLGGDWSRLGDPVVERYLFEEDNLFRDESNAFEEGVRIMKEGGNLSLAALAFEAAAQQNPEHVAAWVYLGSAQAQNEKETAAIRALEQALKLDPNNLEALMGLAVSYTNEGYDSTAYRTLERWLSIKYPQIISPTELFPVAEMGFSDRQVLHEKVTDHFIKAAQLSPNGEHMDPDVQVGLGVLFYGAEEYEKAVDCFQAALHSTEQGTMNQQEQLHLLWNRLGATLANSGRSEEAIAAYEKALSIHPNFVRARYNLGVSCINIGCHHEAAAHFLAALDMHKAIEKSGRSKAYEILNSGLEGDSNGHRADVDAQLDRMSAQNRSTTLYDTLRRVFTQMGRRDLAEKTVAGVDPDIFRPEFDF